MGVGVAWLWEDTVDEQGLFTYRSIAVAIRVRSYSTGVIVLDDSSPSSALQCSTVQCSNLTILTKYSTPYSGQYRTVGTTIQYLGTYLGAYLGTVQYCTSLREC